MCVCVHARACTPKRSCTHKKENNIYFLIFHFWCFAISLLAVTFLRPFTNLKATKQITIERRISRMRLCKMPQELLVQFSQIRLLSTVTWDKLQFNLTGFENGWMDGWLSKLSSTSNVLQVSLQMIYCTHRCIHNLRFRKLGKRLQ